MEETATSLLQNKLPFLLERFRDSIQDATDFRGDLIVVVDAKAIREIVSFLKKNPAMPFEVMMDLFAMDYLKVEPPTPERFAVVYNLYSITHRRRVHLKAYLPEDKPEIDSIHDIYKAVNWFEREAWDLFGIVFRGHPNLHRILCHNDFEGHPMRKDYPADKYQRLKSAVTSSGI